MPKLNSIPSNFNFDKNSYLSLLYDYMPGYETNEEIMKIFNSFNMLNDNMQDNLSELLQLVQAFVIKSIASQKCVKIIIDN